MAQMVKNPCAMRETWVGSLGQEDPLEQGMVNHSGILTWRISMERGTWRAAVSQWGRKESDMTERLSTTHNGVITFFSWSIIDLRCSFCRTAKWFSCMYICILFYVLWKIDLFIFWLLWVFIAACGLSLVLASGGFCFLWCAGFSLWGLRLLQSTGSRCVGFSSCSSRL